MCLARGLVMFCWYVVRYVGTWVQRVVWYVGKLARYGHGTLVRGNGTWYGTSVRGCGAGARGHDTWYGMLALGSCNVFTHWYFGIIHASLLGLPTANNLSIIMFAGDGRNETHVARQIGWLPIPVQPELAPCK